MVGSSVFDSSFQTAIPQLNIEKQLLALAMRDNALNFQPAIASLKGVGKVFSDAEDTLKKANTSAAQRYLENMPWEDRLALEKKGDPLMTLAQEGIPLDLADAELNKAYSDSRTKARKDKTADWVATKLPMIGYNDWVSYMKGDNPYLFSSYGVDEDMDFVNNPDLRKAVEDSMQNNANRFLMDFDASHNITPSEAIRENMTIDQLRYARASDSERSVLAKATKEPADLQTRTNDLADAQRQVELNQLDDSEQKAYTDKWIQDGIPNGSIGKVIQENTTARNNVDKRNAEDLMDAWVDANLNPSSVDPEYIESLKNGNLAEFADVYALKRDMKDRDRDAMKKAVESIDVKGRIHVDPNKGLSDLNPQSAITTLRRLEQFNPDTAKQMKDNAINGLAEGVRKSLTDEERKQLENPNSKAVQNLTVQLYKDYAEYYGVDEDSDYFKEFLAPAIDKALSGRQVIAQRDANAELAATTQTVKDNLTSLGQTDAVKLLTGNYYGSAEIGELEGAILSKTNVARINKHEAGIENLLSDESKRLYESTSEKGQKVILCLALATALNGNLSDWDEWTDDKRDKELTDQIGHILVTDTRFKDTVRYVNKAFPRSLYDKKKGNEESDK